MKMPPTPKTSNIEKYLKIPKGTFDHIPHYAREQALQAINSVRTLEKKRVFRPGLYYIVLTDLCRSTEASAQLGHTLNQKRVETFILTSIEALGYFDPKNYFLPIREIGDAVLIIFSSFEDVHEWWRITNSLLGGRNYMWEKQMTKKQFSYFRLEAKTVVHAGEVAYSDENIPVAQAVNEVFKVEKCFKAQELGVTEAARLTISPVLKDLELTPKLRDEVIFPGKSNKTKVYVVDKNEIG
jgi:hypothetical protein